MQDARCRKVVDGPEIVFDSVNHALNVQNLISCRYGVPPVRRCEKGSSAYVPMCRFARDTQRAGNRTRRGGHLNIRFCHGTEVEVKGSKSACNGTLACFGCKGWGLDECIA